MRSSAPKNRADRNVAVVLVALFDDAVPAWGPDDRDRYRSAQAAAFSTERREDLTDPETLAYDCGRFDGDGPAEWWRTPGSSCCGSCGRRARRACRG